MIFIDIAVLTDSASDNVCHYGDSVCTKRCHYYMNNTMNFNRKGYCDVAHNATSSVNKKLNDQKWINNQWYNNKGACLKARYKWYEVSHRDNLVFKKNNSFVCAKTQFARANQLGEILYYYYYCRYYSKFFKNKL